ncbi:MAG TPA: bifunctional 5,10-methylenetetrahydrofolate dehydrogenase/5,10-methenyltetrahydrofolate cyclohydrolase [Acidobacteriota bacterium]|nr:bifunctional 5,10-methylenetetrahydrofolate dehydrogenase/5,10-methenyltetrahydrofolate cyclohydrolase [Acidobacteriota bacterium]HNB69884.1 bifunctional 5,10-methylenetetrahydrofolate dehydrogenase/5,10-methenyltetrahydrofolate cyclohydrolase [Acidobacteriota bacterium]
MSARLLDGKLVGQKLKQDAAEKAAFLTERGVKPGLAAVLVGDNPASRTYVGSKVKTCAELGLYSEKIVLPVETTTAELLAVVHTLNERTDIHGILVQLPLPPHIDAEAILRAVDPAKDVDGFHPVNAGKLLLKQPGFVACTPAGIIEMLKFYDIPIRGSRAVVIGRSTIVGLPMSLLLLHRDATVTICHSRTKDLPRVAQEADLLIAAIGRTAFVTEEHIRPGAVVIDVGINQVSTEADVAEYFGDDPTRQADLAKKGYTLIGDVHPRHAIAKAAEFTPVPGGVGPLTIAMLMQNTVRAAEWISGIKL